MPEYIEREKLMEYPFRRDRYDKKHGSIEFISGIESVLEYADNIPAADVAPMVHGRWTGKCKSGYKPPRGFVCGRCDCWNERNSFYCPSCGAKMDGGAIDVSIPKTGHIPKNCD